MNQNLLSCLLGRIILFLFLITPFFSEGQERKCFSYEYEQRLRSKYPQLKSIDEYEKALKDFSKQRRSSSQYREPGDVFTIPVIFHVIHNGEPVGSGDNISAALIEAQIEQLNFDYRKTEGTLGYNDNPVGADLLVEFAPALIAADGQLLEEPGINRIDRNDMGWSAPPYGVCTSLGLDDTYIQEVIKPESGWDANQYLNIWLMEINCGILGYAQFPSLTELPGMEDDEGPASTDGVVLLTPTVGGENLANPDGGNFNLGRTATHEVGHWLGLRHIWGDGGCGVDDYCDDTPAASEPNYGCSEHESCGSMDMIENYMDYTDDACMNIFTEDQKSRIDIALLNSPRRAQLEFSKVHLFAFPNLFISEIVDGTETTDLPRFVELYNSNTEAYDLSDVSLRIYFNGQSEHSVSIAIPEGTTIEPGGTFVFSKSEFDGTWGSNFAGVTPDLIDADVNADGNDVYELYDNNLNMAIDVFGQVGLDGNGEDWDYQDARAVRNSYVLTANAGVFSFVDWTITSYDADDSDPGNHLAEIPAFDAAIARITGIENGATYFSCEGEVTVSPVVEIENRGTDSFSSIDLLINQNGNETPITANFEVLQPGERVAYNLPDIVHALEGEFSYTVSIAEEDGNPTNDNEVEVSYIIDLFENTTGLQVVTQTDQYPEEISWAIQDDNGNVIFFNNTFSANDLDISAICLEDGDYTFILYDSYGDGIDNGYSSLYLDDNTEIVTIPGYYPIDAGGVSFNFSIPFVSTTDLGVVLDEPVAGELSFCIDKAVGRAYVENNGTTLITSIVYQYGVEELGLEAYSMDNLFFRPGEIMFLDLPLIDLEEGVNTVILEISSVNGGDDDQASNNINSSAVNFQKEAGEGFILTLNTDNYPEETSWYVLDDEGSIVFSNDELYANMQMETLMCLADGDYDLILEDSYGDGIFNDPALVFTTNELDTVIAFNGGFGSQVAIHFSVPFEFVLDASLEITEPISNESITSCSSFIEVSGIIENTGSIPITSLAYQIEDNEYTIDGFELLPGNRGTISFDIVSLDEGVNNISASLISLNGEEDANPDNDLDEISIDYIEDNSNTELRVELNLDGDSPDTSWQVEDLEGNVLVAAGDYTSNNVTLNSWMCLEDGCYIFRLMDSDGDGGPTASLYLNDELIGAVGEEDWSDEVEMNFCVTRPVAVESFTALANDDLTIELSWVDDPVGALSYQLEKSTDEVNWEDLSENISLESRSYLDVELEQDITYYYRIRKAYDNRNSAWVTASATANMVTGIEDQYNFGDLTLNLYPNPTKDKLNIVFSESIAEPVTIQVLDNTGEVIKETKLAEYTENTEVNISNMSNGIYLVRIQSSKAVLIKKIIKN